MHIHRIKSGKICFHSMWAYSIYDSTTVQINYEMRSDSFSSTFSFSSSSSFSVFDSLSFALSFQKPGLKLVVELRQVENQASLVHL